MKNRWKKCSLEAEKGDPPATMSMETGRPAAIPLHIWWAEGEQRGWQKMWWWWWWGLVQRGRGRGRGRLARDSGWSGGLGTVCSAHTHHKATLNTGSASDRGTTSVVVISQSDISQSGELSNQIKHGAELGHTEHMGEENTTKRPCVWQ